MDIMKKPYEISLWEDQLVFVGKSGEKYFDITLANEKIVSQFYKEIKIATIGSHTMDSPARCSGAKLSRKINGENTLTFNMYYRYWDDDAQDFVTNPFIGLMNNERKVKLRIGEQGPGAEWYDFIIKKADEKSDTKVFAYTCKDQFVNELSKTGFELELDNELENNMGTIDKLAEGILAGSDWELDCANSSNLKQYKEEPLYRVTIKSPINATNALTGQPETIKVPENETKDIYVFYSSINEKKPEWWFLYTDDKFKTNDDLLIDREYPNYFTSVGEYETYPSFVASREDKTYLVEISTSYRGERLVKQAQTKFDATIDKYVGVYERIETDEKGNPVLSKDGKPQYIKDANGKNQKYYGYTESEYSTSAVVANYVANPSNFTSTSGWQTDANQLDYKLDFIEEKIEEKDLFKSFIKFDNKDGAWVMNAGIGGNRSAIGGFVEGERYVLRMKYKASLGGDYIIDEAPEVKICEYRLGNKNEKIDEQDVSGKYIFEEPIFNFEYYDSPLLPNDMNEKGEYLYKDQGEDNGDYVYMFATCLRSISKTELNDWDFRIGLFFKFEGTGTVYIEDVQVFQYKTYKEKDLERLCVPGGKLFSEIKTKYVYYEPDSTMESIEDLKPVYSDYENDPTFIQVYSTDSKIAGANEFTKVRSISGKESNRFNLLQELCETFECWMKLEVEREDNGEIKIDDTGHQKKKISFRESVGKENPIGFRYGINSKSIQRTLDSAAITSKMIVKDNANEFAPNGFCSIARATENPTGENFLLNFDHYVRHGLLDFDVVTNDLYVDANGYLGYYKKLKEINAQRDKVIDEQAGELVNISRYSAAYTTYKTSYDAAVEEQLVVERDILHYTNNKGKDFRSEKNGIYNTWKDDDKFLSYWAKWCQCENIIQQHKPLYEKAKYNLDQVEQSYKKHADQLLNWITQKRELALQFYKKYSRFIQEGSWIKEDYTDPNLYYLDSESTLHTSAQPKVTYNISVIDVAPLAVQAGYEDFAYYNFNLGDRTYIEDVEFFGRSLKDGKTPYREEIVVSEITTELDAPEKNQIKVQNYKTQFEDLFQRITAQTQQAEYHTGEYKRAASIVEPGGSISASTLENSFANNSFKLSNARDQSVVWDSSGITTTSLSNPSEMVRIISGGVFLSTDGGQSWKTGITGSGINTSYLTAGQINTNEIYIMNGNNAAFRWDEKGLAAYWVNRDAQGQATSYNTSRFVRFDHYGIYGHFGDDEWTPISTEEIIEKCPFSLTWSGFSLKNGDGSVKISSEGDIQVLQQNQSDLVERVKIGRIDSMGESIDDDRIYGIRISNSDGVPVMETDSDGNLWLKDRLLISNKDSHEVAIGKLNDNKVIDANSKFIVYGNGRIVAKEGQIGNLQLIENALVAGEENFSIKIGEQDVLQLTQDKLIINAVINAEEGGNIGGFIISNNQLISADEGTSLILNGETGEIIANRITLGIGAKINDYIELGNAKLQTPTFDNDYVFINASNLKIQDTGIIEAGNISINGATSEISSDTFSITSDIAYFQNIVASGSIETAVFKKGSTQAAGGALIFKPSYKVVKVLNQNPENDLITDIVIEMEDPEGFSANQDLWLVPRVGEYVLATVQNFIQISNTFQYTVTLKEGIENNEYVQAIVLGKLNVSQENEDYILAINAGASNIGNGLIKGRGLTLTRYLDQEHLPSLFLGDLSAVNKNGFGLYSDNVYLTGSLTTQVKENSYAGVNTLNGTKATYFENDTSNIVFWAGAEAESSESIQAAPFQVTEQGSIYATRAKLTSSLFVGGRIEGTDIYAARIHGTGQSDTTPALSIYDTNGGISFRTGYGSKQEQETCKINQDGFYSNNNQTAIIFDAQTEADEGSFVKRLQISHKGLYCQNIVGSENELQTGMGLDNSEIVLNILNTEKVKINETSVTFNSEIRANQKISFGEGRYYSYAEDGIDLYIQEVRVNE